MPITTSSRTSANAMSKTSTARCATRCTPSCSPKSASRPSRRRRRQSNPSTFGASPKVAKFSHADRTDMTRCAATGRTPRMTRYLASRSSRPSPFGKMPILLARRCCLRAWNPKRSSTRIGCFTARGKPSRSGAGPGAMSSPMRIRHAFRARATKSGRSASYRRSCNARVKIGSSRYGCSKRPLACGVANWRAPGATCSTSTPERSRLNRRASSSTAR